MSEKQGVILVTLKMGYKSVVKSALELLIRTTDDFNEANENKTCSQALALFASPVNPVGLLGTIHLFSFLNTTDEDEGL